MTLLSVKLDEHMFELKYRPQSVAECILPAHDKQVFLKLVEKKKIPHLILQSNSPGTGKTTVALAIAKDINADLFFVNGSDCKIDFVRNELTRFASSKSIEGRPKIIVIDEFDRAGVAEAQRHLRTFMETYGKNCSIIITCNDINGIIPPLRSRATVVKFGVPTQEDTTAMMREMIRRAKAICDNESIEVGEQGVKVLATLVQKNFPDFRKTINQLDHYSANGIIDEGILSLINEDRGSMTEVVDAIKGKNIKMLRALAPRYASEYPFFIKTLSDELYTKLSVQGVFTMYGIIGENNAMHGLAANVELHLTHCLVQLALNLKSDWT